MGQVSIYDIRIYLFLYNTIFINCVEKAVLDLPKVWFEANVENSFADGPLHFSLVQALADFWSWEQYALDKSLLPAG